jgi:hypothetical protein
MSFQFGALPLGLTKLNVGSAHGVASGGCEQLVADGSAYARTSRPAQGA